MNIENNIDIILEELIKKGSKIDYLKKLRERSLEIAKKDIDLDETLSSIAKEIKEQTEIFLNQKNDYDINYISGISTCIYLPDFKNNGEYKLRILGGKIQRSRSLSVNEETLFDIDSITRLYTYILLFKLEEEGLIDLNSKVSDINPNFQNLDGLTINDLIKGEVGLETHSNIASATNEYEAYEILKLVSISGEHKNLGLYDIVIGDTIEKVIEKHLGEKMTLDEIMYKYLLTPLNLYHTQYNPVINNLSGNGNKKRLVYDKDARILGGMVGSSGIFLSSDDLARLTKSLYRVNFKSKGLLNKLHIERLSQILTQPIEFSKGSFSLEGKTGAYSLFDPNNAIHSSIFVNSIYSDEDINKVKNDKPVGFYDAFEEYKKQIIKNIMIMYISKQYYNRFCNVKENIEVTKYI